MNDKYSGDFDLAKSKKLAKFYIYYLIFLAANSIIFIIIYNDIMMTAVFGMNLFLQVIFVSCGISSAISGDIYTWVKKSRGPKKAGEVLLFSGFIGIFIILISSAYIKNELIGIHLIVCLYIIIILIFQLYLGAIYYRIDHREVD